MNLYLTADGRYVGTQAEAKAAGKGWTPETVPTDKEGLIEYLNAHVNRQPIDAIPDGSIYPAGTPFEEINPLTAAPDMTWKPTPAPSNPDRDLKLQQGRELSQITDYIMDSEGWVLGNIVSASLERMSQLQRQAALS